MAMKFPRICAIRSGKFKGIYNIQNKQEQKKILDNIGNDPYRLFESFETKEANNWLEQKSFSQDGKTADETTNTTELTTKENKTYKEDYLKNRNSEKDNITDNPQSEDKNSNLLKENTSEKKTKSILSTYDKLISSVYTKETKPINSSLELAGLPSESDENKINMSNVKKDNNKEIENDKKILEFQVSQKSSKTESSPIDKPDFETAILNKHIKKEENNKDTELKEETSVPHISQNFEKIVIKEKQQNDFSQVLLSYGNRKIKLWLEKHILIFNPAETSIKIIGDFCTLEKVYLISSENYCPFGECEVCSFNINEIKFIMVPTEII